MAARVSTYLLFIAVPARLLASRIRASIPMIDEPQLQLTYVVPGNDARHILHADREHRLPVDPETPVVMTKRHDRDAVFSINNSTFYIRFHIRRDH